jgi:hypothetical protein
MLVTFLRDRGCHQGAIYVEQCRWLQCFKTHSRKHSADISKVHGGVHRTECASTTMPPEVLPDSSASELKSNVHSAAILLAASNSRIESCVSPPTKTTFLSEALVSPLHNRTTARSQTRVFISSPDSAKSAPARFSFQTNRDSKVAHGDDATTSRADLSSTSSPAEDSSTQALPSTSCTQAASLADRISAVQYEPVTEECVGGDIRCTHACGCSAAPAALCDDVRKSVHSSVAFRSKVAVPLLHYVRTASSSSTCDALNKLEYSSHLQPTVDGSSLAAVSVGCDSQVSGLFSKYLSEIRLSRARSSVLSCYSHALAAPAGYHCY